MKTFLEPTVELLSFQPQEATLANNITIGDYTLDYDASVAFIDDWWKEKT